MKETTSLYKWLTEVEQELDEKIIAISVSVTIGQQYSNSIMQRPHYYADNLHGIDDAPDHIIMLLQDKFPVGYGGASSHPFTAWTENWVIFPTEYDGWDGINHVRRNPVNIPTEHI